MVGKVNGMNVPAQRKSTGFGCRDTGSMVGSQGGKSFQAQVAIRFPGDLWRWRFAEESNWINQSGFEDGRALSNRKGLFFFDRGLPVNSFEMRIH
ncbi:hypothetical protein AYX07_03235 [Thermoactinomyces sp. AS95]|jgi:hypothetical protein|nr:hypothetical protein JS81_03265 [Thermoactinomyces sp. Gus2-1]KYQ87710.1 hypothetical protein AYX07_03235 [Thermoactinomyces sp. AS95]